MKTNHKIIILWLLPLLTACFKEDDMIEAHPRGNALEATIGLTQNYQFQVYYDLSAAQETAKAQKTTHDLLFDNHQNGWRIWLNTSLFIRAAHTGSTNFEEVTDTIGVRWAFDKSDGNPDSNAIGAWLDTTTFRSNREVILIDRGLDLTGHQRGIYKLVIDSVSTTAYWIKYSKIDETSPQTLRIPKSDGARFTALLLDAPGTILIAEPPSVNWDLLFTQYTTLLYTDIGEAYPYLVTGVLINQDHLSVCVDSAASFALIDRNFAAQQHYTNQRDVIGYLWKSVQGDVTTGNVTYVVRPELTYLISEKNGFYYKLRFVGFYSSSGEKGYPKFEFQQL